MYCELDNSQNPGKSIKIKPWLGEAERKPSRFLLLWPGLIYVNECNIPNGWFWMWQLAQQRNRGSLHTGFLLRCTEFSLLLWLFDDYFRWDWNHTLMTRSAWKKKLLSTASRDFRCEEIHFRSTLEKYILVLIPMYVVCTKPIMLLWM